MAKQGRLARRLLPAALVLKFVGAAWLLGLPSFSAAAPEKVPRFEPLWIAAEGRGDRVVLVWASDSRFAVVRIYRAVPAAPGAPVSFELIGESRTNTFTDTKVASDARYLYRLTALDGEGREGRPSAEQSVQVAGRPRTPPAPPVWVGYLSGGKGITLKWNYQEGADIIAYNIYRKLFPDTMYRLVGSLTASSFTDTSVEANKPVTYALTALDSSFRETSFSEELPALYTRQTLDDPGGAGPTLRLRRTRLLAMVSKGDQPFLRPADVAVGPVSGDIYVADSGRNRIFVFNANGSFLRSIGVSAGDPFAFKRIVGLGVDREETIYAVDAGQGAVFAFAPQGGARRRLPLPLITGKTTGFVDCAVGADGSVFVVDNSNDTVLLSGGLGAPLTFGVPGFGPGEFSAPTFCATDAKGNFYVADSLNARVQVFSGTGEFVRAFGRARRGLGGMLRPKGVAIAANGEIYVADSWQNTVQVFNASGRHVAVLADESGAPLDLGSPNGVGLGAGNRVYIAERLSARLQIREIIDETR